LVALSWFGAKKSGVHPPISAVTPASLAKETPAAPQRIDGEFLQAVAALPPDEQAKRVIEKLKELNPAFDPATATYAVENGVVVTFGTSITAIRDISPLRALVSLKQLRLGQIGQVSLLADLHSAPIAVVFAVSANYLTLSSNCSLSGSERLVRFVSTEVGSSQFAAASLELSYRRPCELHRNACSTTASSDLSPSANSHLWLGEQKTRSQERV